MLLCDSLTLLWNHKSWILFTPSRRPQEMEVYAILSETITKANYWYISLQSTDFKSITISLQKGKYYKKGSYVLFILVPSENIVSTHKIL